MVSIILNVCSICFNISAVIGRQAGRPIGGGQSQVILAATAAGRIRASLDVFQDMPSLHLRDQTGMPALGRT